MTAIVLQRPKNNSDNSVALNRLLKRVFKKQMLQNTAVGKLNIFSKYVRSKKARIRRGAGGSVDDQRGAAEAVREIQGGGRKAESRHFHCTIGVM